MSRDRSDSIETDPVAVFIFAIISNGVSFIVLHGCVLIAVRIPSPLQQKQKKKKKQKLNIFQPLQAIHRINSDLLLFSLQFVFVDHRVLFFARIEQKKTPPFRMIVLFAIRDAQPLQLVFHLKIKWKRNRVSSL